MISIQNVSKVYQSRNAETWALANLNLTISEGEFVSIVGPSGCGKSTLLNIIAGFLAPTSGAVSVAGQIVADDVPDSLGYIFQKDTLLPWYTVRKNVALGLKFKGIPVAALDGQVDALLELGKLSDFGSVFPHQLSGGMRRRVALLMSLAVEPKILLLDEPFGALDTHTRTHLHREFLDIWRKLRQTVVLVTHDLDEAITLSNRVVVLSRPPSRILLDEVIDIPYPRDVFQLRQRDDFARYLQQVWSVLGEEFRAEV